MSGNRNIAFGKRYNTTAVAGVNCHRINRGHQGLKSCLSKKVPLAI